MVASAELWSLISESLHNITGCGAITDSHALSGGSINSAYRVNTEEGVPYFVKLNTLSSLSMFEAESDGLDELVAANAIRVPLAVTTGSGAGHSWLVSEYINLGSGESTSQRLLGLQMAALHRNSDSSFGWYRDNTIGSTAQINTESDSWVDFYRDNRLKFQLDLAARNGFTGSLQSKGERLLADLDSFFTDYSPQPSLLHGDLWGGNAAFDEQGQPLIFDPAVYYGDREADVAMTELFGGFSTEFYAAYNDSWQLDTGYRVRKTLYNLYHILNHANLFAGGYAAQAESMMDQLLSEI
ncbi:fructosamine kinase family protein [Mariprofundus sp. NF]|uniref:fructosamine kinase family protein n=1 Tax=Mariprofundus sp. NF TaxID=2608716 RepID=UPI0015A463E5|nr:fructosamine kinase family protein [Mariprofundus sp. NF]NWF39736.1 fructosamine kinase family protein [Mariprofundus sp. NF]